MSWEQPEGYRVTSHPTGAASLPVIGQSHKPAFRVRLPPCDAVTTCNGSPVVYHDGLQGRASVKHDPLEDQARTLQATGAYRVLRRIAPLPLNTQESRNQTRVGIFLDLETTGLDPIHDEIIEFGMVPFVYTLDGRSLGYLVMQAGWFFNGHRAADDCLAGVTLLTTRLPKTQTPALSALLQEARQPRWQIWAENAPFDLKDRLKARGYRWNDGTDGCPKAWFTEVPQAQKEEELHFLKTEIYLREVSPLTREVTAWDRFSIRA